MKRTKILIGGFALALCGVMFALQSETENLPELQMENIEALSQTEPTISVICYRRIKQVHGCEVRYCSTCTYLPDSDIDGTGDQDHCKTVAE